MFRVEEHRSMVETHENRPNSAAVDKWGRLVLQRGKSCCGALACAAVVACLKMFLLLLCCCIGLVHLH